ncbi:AAA family ATPase [Omnitrophica bacterium]|nr:AAA family ATPase [Candidatus Omnitrophota bacterium]
MSYTIGFAGKGGTGKSTIASIVIRYLTTKKTPPILAIDADPNTSLGEMLGITPEETVVGIIDDISANIANLPQGVTKERLVESRIQQSLGEGEGLDLLIMGRPEGPGCYCYPNSLMRETIGRLERSYNYIIIDNEAGMEHISRRTDRKIDYLFVISDHTAHGIRSAKRILDLANELKIARGKTHLIVNRAKNGLPSLENNIKKINIEKVDYLNESNELSRLSAEGRPLSELGTEVEFVKSVYKICEDAQWH